MVNSNTNKLQQEDMKKSLWRRGSRLNLSLLSYWFIFLLMLSCVLGNFMLPDHRVKSFPYWHSNMQSILINDSGP